MKKIILHIGRHKTGTTSLQHFLHANFSKELEHSKLLYPTTGMNSNHFFHHDLFKSCIERNNKFSELETTKNLIKEINNAHQKNIFISTEILSRDTIDAALLRDIKKCFENYNVIILIYLRRQDSYLESAYAERIKRGLISSKEDIFSFNAELDYKIFIQKFSSVFGEPNIHIKLFEESVKTCIYKDLLNYLSIKIDSNINFPDTNANIRLPWNYLYLLKNTNNKLLKRIILSQKFKGLFRRLARLIPVIFDGRSPLNEKNKKELLIKYNESNSFVSQKYLSRKDLY